MRRVARASTILLIALCGCGKLLAFDTDVSTSGVIPGRLGAAGTLPGEFDAGGSLSKAFDDKGADNDHVESVKVTLGRLTASQTVAGSHLGYFSKFEVYVSATGKEKALIGRVDPAKFANQPGSVDFTLEDVELKPYLVAGGMKMTPEITLATRPASDVPISLNLTVHVVPKL